ncbi:BQ2448_402 [Microbotryum intermedium]|uniref:BQ2448_402 protein n=1 Tax=Microbotryum intermedium TaxID=269621 RepID=A0A238F864_9BASI|nr:BQ2448_402 [Microbotryum intermedium]
MSPVVTYTPQPLESSWMATYLGETTDFSADLLDSAFGTQAHVEPTVDESFYINYPEDDNHSQARRPSSSHSTSASDSASFSVPGSLPAAPTSFLVEASLSPLSDALLTPTDERPNMIEDRHWYLSETLLAHHALPASQAVPQQPLLAKFAPAAPRIHQQPQQPQRLQPQPQKVLAARRHGPLVQPIAVVQPASIGLGVSPREGAQKLASATEVDQSFDELKDLLPGEVALRSTPTTPQVQYYHVAGVMLDAEDHSAYTDGTALAPRYVAASSSPPTRVYAYSPPSHGPSRMGMMPPSPSYAHPPHTAIGFGFNYTIAPSHPYGDHVQYAYTPPPRPRSAPASPELASEGFEAYPAQLQFHRRPSMIGTIPREQNARVPHPSYHEVGYHPYAQVPRAHMRVQSHPAYTGSAPLVRPQPTVPMPMPPMPPMSPRPSMTTSASASGPPTPNKVAALTSPSPMRRPSMAGRKGKRSGSGGPMFINFTSVDAPKLLSGVAPSGSSKRKREENEQRRRSTSSATSGSDEASAPAEVVTT